MMLSAEGAEECFIWSHSSGPLFTKSAAQMNQREERFLRFL